MAGKRPPKPAKAVVSQQERLSRGRTRQDASFPVGPRPAQLPESYAATLEEIKRHLQQARVKSVLAANAVVIGVSYELR